MKELQIPIKWKFRLEKDFTTAWLKSLKDKWFYTDKISDWSIWNKKIDCYIATDKKLYICEVKVINKDIFPIKRLRSNQKKALRLINNLLPWCALICIYSISFNKYKIFSFDKIKDVSNEDSVKLEFIDI